MVRLIRAALVIFIVGLFIFAARSTPTLPLDKIKLPPGFSIKVFAIGVPNAPQAVVITDRFPTEQHHGWKFIAFGPDGMMYVPVGAPCNICRPDERHGVIDRMNADGSGLESFANGIRNSVGFDWHPVTKELWFTDNGVDGMGDNLP